MKLVPRRSNSRYTILAILAVIFAAPMAAQTTTSSITGVVKDSSDAAIPAAKIRVSNEASGVALPATTNASGMYRVVSLIPGTYRIEVEAQGFQKLVRTGVVVQISETVQVDLVLQVGSLQETVNVSETTSVLATESSSVDQLIARHMVDGMPLPNRTSTALIALIPGATVQDVTGSIPIFSVGGGRMRNQQFTLDGGNHGNTVGLAVNQTDQPLPMDAIQEFRVLENNYSAEYGQTQSGVITEATRSGTNTFHGSLFEYARNEALNARNFFSAARPRFRQHQFGGTFGGPIRKDKTHFFVSYERTQQRLGSTGIQTVPTALQRTGDFSATLNASGKVIPIYDPLTTTTTNGATVRDQFPGNIIPTSRIDSVARGMAAFWPLPNVPGTITGGNNYRQNTIPKVDRDIVVARVDHQFNASNQFMSRFFIANEHDANPGYYPKPEADPSANKTDQTTYDGLANWTHTFRPNLLNEVRFSMVRRDYATYSYGLDGKFASQFGLSGVSDAGFPIVSVTGFQGLGGSPSRYSSPLDDYQFQEAVSWFKGKHALKIGMEARWGIFNDNTDTSSSGNFGFTALLTALPNVSGTGNALATFLLGEANSVSLFRSDPIRSRAQYWGSYIQDDWRLSSTFTVNLGFRWEGTTPRTEDNNRMNAFSTTALNPVSGTPGVITFAGQNGVPNTAWDFYPYNFGPRAGFAWRFHQKTVLRGGGGIFYGPTTNDIVGTAATLGFSTNCSLSASQAGITYAMVLASGLPSTACARAQVGPSFGAVPLGSPTTTAVTFFERSRPTPRSSQFNLNVQRELASNLSLEVGWAANLSHHLTSPGRSINQVLPSEMGPGNAQLRRPFPQFTNVSVINPPLGNSSYHAGIIKVERRFSAGLSLLAHYTFSKFIDDAESFSEFGSVGSYMNYYNRRLDRGLSGSDVRHRSVMSAVYDLPLLENHGWLTRLAGGWKTGAILTFQSGPAFTVYSSVDQTNAFPAGTNRANVIGDAHASGGAISQWFNTAAFALPSPYTFGSAGRGILNGPGMWNIDASFVKGFPIRERLRAEVKAEFFNFLNHANFGLPGAAVGNPNFGIISSAKDGRSGQLAARIEF
jgi:hypothetical protein